MKKIVASMLSGAMFIGAFSFAPGISIHAENGEEEKKYEVIYEKTYEDRKSGEEEITITDPVLVQEEKVVTDSVRERTEDRIHYIKLNGDTSQSSDAILIESNGHYGLIDSSNRSGDSQYGISIMDSASGKAVLEYMNEVGVDHLDFIMATHSHSDHIGGIPEIAASAIATELTDTSSVYEVTQKYTDEKGNEVHITPIDELSPSDVLVSGGSSSAGSGTETVEVSLNPEDYEDIVISNEGEFPLVDENTVYIFKSFTINKTEASWNNDWYFTQASEAMDNCHKLMVNSPSSDAMSYLGATFNAGGSDNKDDTISFKFGDFSIELYNIYSQSNTDENANSIVAYVEKSNIKTVLLADLDVNDKLEQQIAKYIVNKHGKVDVMKVGHHGYTKSTSKELIDTFGAKYAVIQTTNKNLKDYSPFYAYMKAKEMKLYRTMDQDDASVIQDMTDGKLQMKQGTVQDRELYEVYKKTSVYETSQTTKQKYERYEISTPVVTPIEIPAEESKTDDSQQNPVETEPSPDPEQPSVEEPSPDPEQPSVEEPEVGPNGGEIITDPTAVQTTETVIESWYDNITTKSSLTKDTIVYRDKAVVLGDAPNEWVQTDGIDNWAMWYNDFDEYFWVYVNKDGSFKKGWQKINNETYLFDDNGIMQTGWQVRNKKKVYLLEKDYNSRKVGSMMTGWYNDGTGWSFFDADGSQHEGWQLSGTDWYYCKTGKIVTGPYSVNGVIYIFDKDGKMADGRKWTTYKGKKYYSNADGTAYSGWMLDAKGNWYYLNADGSPTTGWQQIGGVWYYLDKDGIMGVGWIHDGKNWYYMDSSGGMVSNAWVGGYWLGGGGAWTYLPTGYWMVNSTGWWYEDTTGWYPTSTWQKINGEWYYFKSSGYMATEEAIDGCWVNADGQWEY